MKPKKKKVMEVKEEDHEEEEEDEEEEEKEIIAKGILNWREAVENASTYSRLHVLLGVLDACIKWEKSAENAKCKICRRKDDDATLLLCDECNQAFHMHCLRPALISIPKGDWHCPACAEENEEIEHEEKCVECGGDEELIYCAECPAAYHLECHEPPLRRPPRGHWSCNECKTGVKRKTRSKSRRKTAVQQKRAPQKRRKYKEESESEESEEESEEEEDEESSGEQDDEDDEDYIEEPPSKAPRKSQQQQSARQSVREKKASPRGGRRSKESQKTSVEIEEEKPKSRRAPSDLSVPDYHKIIKHPMDLQKIKDKLRCMVYGSVTEVVKDVQLIFSNSEEYNKAGSEVLQCTEEIETYFSNLMKKDLPLYQYERRRKLTNGFMEHDQTSKSRGRR
ncbi:hypothetical protein KUTeg_022986 [Tegillarca granosa]|uniref:Uncharacterized protein n=1 Tax=Tegillarca granosa TaxID=220873 RepID=A0ABQ9E0C1_TEGGR|nr:hypothetical protein KUTeg_022986 [Tegillarca granosa]